MSFADDYAEYQRWKAQLSDTPEAWEEYKVLKAKAEQWDTYADVIAAIKSDLYLKYSWDYIGVRLSDFEHYFRKPVRAEEEEEEE